MRITIDRHRGHVLADVGEPAPTRVRYGANWRAVRRDEVTRRQENAIRAMGGTRALLISPSGYVAFAAKRAGDYGADFYTVSPDARTSYYTGRVDMRGTFLFRGA